jgi:hypothetical protein
VSAWFRLLGRLGFYRHHARSRFAQALAQLGSAGLPRSGPEQWASYRLCLYDTVAKSKWDGRHVRGGVAVAGSLAACGRIDEAAAVARQLAARKGGGRHRGDLIDGLAPFAPELALELLTDGTATPALQAALLLRTGRRADAATLLQRALAAGQAQDNPELHLLATNALGGEPSEQLARMNRFLAAHALTSLALQDAARPPSPVNLVSAVSLPATRGPLVSVLMTAYNTADRIGAAIRGLLAQSYRDVEVIVVDDASTDTTGDVVRAIAEQDARVKYVPLPSNVGTYVAKTVGLHHAGGDFVTCHDSDDWSHPLRLEQQVQPLLSDKRLVATTSQWIRMQDDGVYYARQAHPLMRLNPASPLFRRQLVMEKSGLWDLVRTGADSEFLARLRLVFGRRAVRQVRQPLALGGHRPDSLMTAASTGYSATGVSPARLAYWENWTHWHIAELRAGSKPVMPLGLLAPRPFGVPDEITVPRENVARCMDAFGLQC